MNRKQALRWLHRNAGLTVSGVWHVTRFDNKVESKDWNQFRDLFLVAVAAENVARQAATV